MAAGVGDGYGVPLGAHGLQAGVQAGAHPPAGWQ